MSMRRISISVGAEPVQGAGEGSRYGTTETIFVPRLCSLRACP